MKDPIARAYMVRAVTLLTEAAQMAGVPKEALAALLEAVDARAERSFAGLGTITRMTARGEELIDEQFVVDSLIGFAEGFLAGAGWQAGRDAERLNALLASLDEKEPLQ